MGDGHTVDPELLAAWLNGRSIARSVPMPVPDRGGWRVDTGSPDESCRYVFAAAEPGFHALAADVTQPGIALRLCVDDPTMRRLLPDRWKVGAPSFVMTGPDDTTVSDCPPGYISSITTHAGAIEGRIHAADGTLAASGYAAEAGGIFIYDRIVVVPAHWRCGLGRALMALLGGQRRSVTSRQVLVATDMGRGLYASLGWRDIGPYASAVIPAPPA